MILRLSGIVLVVLNVGLALRGCLRNIRSVKFIEGARHRVRRLLALVRRGEPEQSDPRGKLVLRRAQHRRAEAAATLYMILAAWLCLVNLPLLWSKTAREMTLGQASVVLALHTMCAFVNATPMLTRRLLGIYYASTMVFTALFPWFGSPDHFMYNLSLCIGIRGIASVSNFNVAVSIACTLLGACADTLSVWCGTPSVHERQELAWYAWGGALVTCLMVVLFRHWFIAGIRQEVDIGILRSERSASMSLLDKACDVVVELSSDTAIASDSRALAAFLLKNPGTSIAAMPFCDLIPEEGDRRTFRESVAASRASAAMAVGTVHVDLLDGLSNRVKVEIFFVRVNVLDEDCRYILGIREFTDEVAGMPLSKTARREQRPRQARERRGTPHTSERTSLEASQPIGRAEESARLRHPGLLQTKHHNRTLVLLEALTCWNIEIPEAACCSLHAYIADARALLRDLRTRDCVRDFPDLAVGSKQCQGCGLLAPSSEFACVACDSSDLRVISNVSV